MVIVTKQLNDTGDAELALVAAHLMNLDPTGQRVADILRATLDQLLDGRRDGRFEYTKLSKTEKTFMGTLVEINLFRRLGLDAGDVTDYRIAGVEVDCKFSQRLRGWEIGPEIVGYLCLVITANDMEGTWKAGLIRADESNLMAENRDKKRKISLAGSGAIKWLWEDHGHLDPNQLLRLKMADAAKCERIMKAVGGYGRESGQARILQLLQEVQGVALRRTTIETVGYGLDDPMKRVRGNGGAREKLRSKGIIILGHQDNDPVVASALRQPVPKKGEFVAVRVSPAPKIDDGRPIAEIEGTRWVVANESDPPVLAPIIPRKKA
jgi:hypothetical protein